MTTCELAATGIDSGALLPLLALAVLLLWAGVTVVLFRRGGRRRATLLALAPLLCLGLVATGASTSSPAAASAVPASDCPVAVAPAPPGAAPAAAHPTPPSAEPTPEPTPDPTPEPSPPAVEYTPGAAGIGDPYFPLDGNGGYTVDNYALDLAYDPTTDELAGTATITAEATQNLSSFNFDFDGLTTESITVDDETATWSTATTQISAVTGQPLEAGSADPVASPPRTELTVVPARGIDADNTFTVVVAYRGIPITVNDVFGAVSGVIHTDDGMLVVGQPRVAATWFPANDHPSDKATFEFRISVPEGLEVVANGRLVGDTVEDGRSIWEWVADAPMATYLATASVGEFTLNTDTQDGITHITAIDPDLYTLLIPTPEPAGLSYGQVAADSFAAEPGVIEFLATQFGPYPFDDAGGIADDVTTLQFALENQTRPIYPLWAFENPADPRVVVHELAHQWYGDSVTLERWSDIWLNEGFATYAEWLWDESTTGVTPQQQFDVYYALDPADPLWATTVGDPGAAGIFDGSVYVRGAMTLQALRTQVGDDVFFDILQGWASANEGGNVTTAEFIAYATEVSGQNLDALFTTWLSTAAKP